MAFTLRGERFNVDLSSDDEDSGSVKQSSNGTPSAFVIRDVTERAMPKAPAAPTVKPTSTGFPAHKKRATESRFKQQRIRDVKPTNPSQSQPVSRVADAPARSIDAVMNDSSHVQSTQLEEIDKENKQKLSRMSDEEISLEQEELMQQLSPSLIQKLLRRANIDEAQATDFPIQEIQQTTTDRSNENNSSKGTAEDTCETAATSIHFPRPPLPPQLDPSSPEFLTDLHEKYFPNLSHDPSKLEWMSPSSSSTNTQTANTYASSASSLPISALRFSFTGALLAPTVSNSIPTSQGLHHHGDSPEAAGYTIAELAHLARSSFPTQRCFAFQTLGRILYRLGTGEFGALQRGFQGGGGIPRDPEDDEDNGTIDGEEHLQDLARGLWDCIRQGRVLETLEKEANKEGGHVSAKAHATEALWLWRKGGGTEVRAT